MSVDGRNRLDDSQLEALEPILGLGNPGSGKTDVIAKAAVELVRRGGLE
jgi:superfamily I DNA/RNA helicase